MMGTQAAPEQLFYDFCLEDHVPSDHMLRRIDPFLDLNEIRATLKPYYSHLGRPSIDPELMIRMLIVGYCLGIRSERRLCEEVHLNLAYRWFCGLGLKGKVPKFISPSDPAAQWTGAHKGPAFFAYATNSLIDVENAVIVDVEASRAIRQAEVGAARTMIERVEDRFGLKPKRLAADAAYGSAPMLAWLVSRSRQRLD